MGLEIQMKLKLENLNFFKRPNKREVWLNQEEKYIFIYIFYFLWEIFTFLSVSLEVWSTLDLTMMRESTFLESNADN